LTTPATLLLLQHRQRRRYSDNNIDNANDVIATSTSTKLTTLFLHVVRTLAKHIDLGENTRLGQVENELCESGKKKHSRDVLFYGMNLYHMFYESSKKAFTVMIKQFGQFDWVPGDQETIPARVAEDASVQFLL
jgi:hypothetical protein